MIAYLLAARRRVTEFWNEGFRNSGSDEVTMSLTGHIEEVHIGFDGDGFMILEQRSVPRFGIVRRPACVAYRIIGRGNGRLGPVVEWCWPA